MRAIDTTDSSKLNRLLDQLYTKKTWLDTMISGLEAAVKSPDHQLIESVARTFGNGRQGKPKVDIQRQQRARLARLAGQVRGSRSHRRRHRRPSKAPGPAS